MDDYAAENDLTQSEAVRRLIVAGLDATEQPTTEEIAADLRELRKEIESDGEQEEKRAELHQGGTFYQAAVLGLLVLILAAQMGAL